MNIKDIIDISESSGDVKSADYAKAAKIHKTIEGFVSELTALTARANRELNSSEYRKVLITASAIGLLLRDVHTKLKD